MKIEKSENCKLYTHSLGNWGYVITHEPERTITIRKGRLWLIHTEARELIKKLTQLEKEAGNLK